MASRFSGIRNAFDYAYGVNPDVPPMQVIAGSTGTGSYTITLAYGYSETVDGQRILPSVTTPISIGAGATAETVTPSAVSNPTPDQYGTCTITATFSNAHAMGDQVRSGSFGLVEAVNASNSAGGGLVIIDSRWTAAGGVNGTLTGNKGFTNVCVLDNRGTVSGSAFSYKAASNGANMAVTTVSWY